VSSGTTIKVFWHTEGQFYTVKNKRLNELISLDKMRMKILTVKNATWKWHVVLTFSDEKLNTVLLVEKHLGAELTPFFKKVKNKIATRVMGKKRILLYFWKYEEGGKVWCNDCKRKVEPIEVKMENMVKCEKCGKLIFGKGRRPHFHVLFDMEVTEVQLKKWIHPQHWENVDWKRWLAQQRRYKMNKKKSDLEILCGYYLKKKWGNGIAHARKIKSYFDIVDYVIKDFYKFSESKYLKQRARKWGYPIGSKDEKTGKRIGALGFYDEMISEKKIEREWQQVLEEYGIGDVKWAYQLVRSTKDNLIEYYDAKEKKGGYIYKRIINDLLDNWVGTVAQEIFDYELKTESQRTAEYKLEKDQQKMFDTELELR